MALEVVEQYVDQINAHSVEDIVRLLTDDHLFIDSLGHAIRGREATRQAWKLYFEWMPDYRIVIKQKFERDSIVGLFGKASGTHAVRGALRDENRWEIPAAWRAMVRDGLVAEWQVYADNKPVYEIISRDPNRDGSG